MSLCVCAGRSDQIRSAITMHTAAGIRCKCECRIITPSVFNYIINVNSWWRTKHHDFLESSCVVGRLCCMRSMDVVTSFKASFAMTRSVSGLNFPDNPPPSGGSSLESTVLRQGLAARSLAASFRRASYMAFTVASHRRISRSHVATNTYVASEETY